MNADAVFQIANLAAIAGWLVLLASPLIDRGMPAWSDRIAGLGLPGLLAFAYVATIAWFWGEQTPLYGQSVGTPGFDSIEGVAALLGTREALVAGWIHYLAFDLFVGAWQVRDARRRSIPFWMVVPCLFFTFVSGPFGLLLYLVLRTAYPSGEAVRSV